MWKLFIDDERFPVTDDWEIARTSQEAINLVTARGMPRCISFDHDLGGEDTSIVFLKWVTEKVLDRTVFLPFNFEYHVHSQNPIGAKNIKAYMDDIIKIQSERPVAFPSLSEEFLNPELIFEPTQTLKKVEKTDDERYAECMEILSNKIPRFVKSVEILWGHKEFEDWMAKLIIADRARAGFDDDIFSALLSLSRIHTKKFGVLNQSTDIWKTNNKLI